MHEFLGFGLGLRTTHFEEVLRGEHSIDWFEIVSENFMVAGGKPKYYLREISERYPLVMHGVSMSIGSTDALNWEYLERLRQLMNAVKPAWVSDHLCWTGVDGVNSHDLLPLPYTESMLQHLVERILIVQDYLQRPMVFENVSAYLTYKQDEMPEWVFLQELAKRTGCKLLVDINNIYVSSRNFGFSPSEYLGGISAEHVQQFHLAGHSDYGDYVIDTHDQDIRSEVWELYAEALTRYGAVSTLIERDDHIPPLDFMLTELAQARQIAKTTLGEHKVKRIDHG